jgi:uncharacterized protein YgbK (DUF1537 family)
VTLPHRLVAWYGDDFTGSTDVLEVMASCGVESLLFLRQPDDSLLRRFEACRAIGLAGSSRSQTPEWMDAHLPSVFRWLSGIGAAICHYKVCSTFDSAPHVGSIGRAIDIGQAAFRPAYVPIVVGAPALRRYVAFGNLFATADGGTHRIDRHPVMSRHPVTPMDEADLRLHLARQTGVRTGLIDLLALASEDPAERLRAQVRAGVEAVLFDTVSRADLLRVGSLLWDEEFRQPFAAGSSGVEYALTACWLDSGALPAPPPRAAVPPADRMVVLSGSCSPVTADQIGHARANGYTMVSLDAEKVAEGDTGAASDAIAALREGRSVVLHSAAGTADVRGSAWTAARQIQFRHALGDNSGRILRRVLDETGVRRVVVAGGDTSSHAGRLLEIDCLSYICPLAPGAPLCRAWSKDPTRDGIEIVFKGGQCGADDFFSLAQGRTP